MNWESLSPWRPKWQRTLQAEFGLGDSLPSLASQVLQAEFGSWRLGICAARPHGLGVTLLCCGVLGGMVHCDGAMVVTVMLMSHENGSHGCNKKTQLP